MSPTKTAQFQKASVNAVSDPKIQQALDRVMGHFIDARADIIERDFGNEAWERLRDRAAMIKANAIQNLDYYLDLADRNVRRNGGHVHFADDAAAATRIVLDIAARNGVKRVVKGKSMVSEEMELNGALERAGIESIETDLGEYIIQLAKEPPFHIIAPAMHKSRHEVSRLFEDWLRSQPTDNIERLCRIARDTLREKFAAADMGITGANFVIAETGTVVVVTNEGNGRMVTSAPRVHVAICGMEKVVPAIEDLATFLRLLPRSATGQRITSYTTFVGGPKAASDEDGPDEFHLIFVDNGRLKLLKDEILREALSCIRCGACLNHCPVYQRIGGHAYGWVYSGPIGAVVTPVMTDLKEAKDLPYASSLCGTCRDVCPVKIDIPRLLLHLRWRIAEGTTNSPPLGNGIERLYVRRWFNAVKTKEALESSARLARLAQRPFAKRGRVRGLPLPMLSGWTATRDFPAVADKSFHQVWKERLAAGGLAATNAPSVQRRRGV